MFPDRYWTLWSDVIIHRIHRRVLRHIAVLSTPASAQATHGMTSHNDNDDADNELPAAVRKFILHWGEMGTRWGINRTVAQIHALLYLSAEPLHADEIAATLSRGALERQHQPARAAGLGHRPGRASAGRPPRSLRVDLQDVWEMLRIIVEERKRREIDPTIAVLRDCARSWPRPNRNRRTPASASKRCSASSSR